MIKLVEFFYIEEDFGVGPMFIEFTLDAMSFKSVR